MAPPDPSLDDEAFLDLLLERAMTARAEGRVIDVDELTLGRPHLRARAISVLALATQVAPVTSPKLLSSVTQVAGYTILGEAGRGGMGIVYRARQERLGRTVALKVLAPALNLSARARARFDMEARALGRVRHPNVVAVHDVLATPDLCAYAMEWLDGRSLAATLVQGHGTLDVPAVVQLGITLARALAAVHAAGLVHRDVKPSNVLLRTDGTPVLTDFGLVLDAEQSMHTATGEFVGTMAYAAPEQLRGQHEQVGPWTDVYALAATLHATLTGAPPFEGASTATLLRRVETGARTPLRRLVPQVSRDLDTVIEKAIDPRAARRYQTAAEFADDLRRVQACEPIAARRISRFARTVLWSRRNPVVAAVLAVLLVASCITAWQAQVAITARRTSDRNLDRAQRAIAQLVAVARDELKDAAGMGAQREAMLRSALSFYADLLNDHPRDARSRRDQAIAKLQAGALRKELGELAQAERELTGGLTELEASGTPSDSESLSATAAALRALAGVQFDRGQVDAASTTAERSVAAYARLVERAPDHWQQACELHLFQAAVAWHAGQWERLEKAVDTALEMLSAREREGNLTPDALSLRAQAHSRRGAALCRRRDLPAGRVALELALADLRAVAAALPHSRSDKGRLAEALLKHAELTAGIGDQPAAMTSLRDATAHYTALVRDFPEVADYREALERARELEKSLASPPPAPPAAPADRAANPDAPRAAPSAKSLRDQLKHLLEQAHAARRANDAETERACLQQVVDRFDPAQASRWRDVELVLREVPHLLRRVADPLPILVRVTGWLVALQHLGTAPASVAQPIGELGLLRAITSLERGDARDAETAVTAAQPLLDAAMREHAAALHAEAVTLLDPAHALDLAHALAEPRDGDAKTDAATATWRTGTSLRIAGMAHAALDQPDQAHDVLDRASTALESARRELPDDLGLTAEWARLCVDRALLRAKADLARVPLLEALRALQALRDQGPRTPAKRHIAHALRVVQELPEASLDAAELELRAQLRPSPTGR